MGDVNNSNNAELEHKGKTWLKNEINKIYLRHMSNNLQLNLISPPKTQKMSLGMELQLRKLTHN
jgi:hypothetical protein